jgi:hypothetical protein
MLRFLVVLMLICGLGHPLTACINDSATRADEEQFVSGYDEQGKARRVSVVGKAISTFNPLALLLLLPGIALVGVGAIWVRQERQLAEKRQSVAYRQNKVER